MRILHINSLYYPKQRGGAEKSVALLAESQVKAGDDVFVACGWPSEEGWSAHKGVQIRRVKHKNRFWQEDWPQHSKIERAITKFEEGFNHAYARSFGDVMDECKPDIVHTHSLVAMTPKIWEQARVRKIPTIHTLRDFDLICTRTMRVRSGNFCENLCRSCYAITMQKQRLCRNVDAVVGISRDILSRHLDMNLFQQVPEARRFVIYNSVELQENSQVELSGEAIKFGFMGRISEEKGLQVLIEACRKLSSKGWVLQVAGEVPAEAHDFLKDRGEDLPIEWLGWVKPDQFLRAIDILVMPSIWPEPFGRVTVEAFAHGVPVIGTRMGGTTDLLAACGDEWLVQPNDAMGLAAAMQSVIDKGRPLQRPLGAMKQVLELCDPKKVAENYREAYMQLLGS